MSEQPPPEGLAHWHRDCAVEGNDVAGPPREHLDRTPAATDVMRNAAHAAALHRAKVGYAPHDAPAAAVGGDDELHATPYRAARAAGDAIADGSDKAMFQATFAVIPVAPR